LLIINTRPTLYGLYGSISATNTKRYTHKPKPHTPFIPKVTFKKQKPYLQRVNQSDQGPEQKAETQLSDQNDSILTYTKKKKKV